MVTRRYPSRPGQGVDSDVVRFIAAVALLIAALAMAAGAGAGESFRSAVKILDDQNGDPPGLKRNYYPHFTGTVRSPKDKCEAKRTVNLFRETGDTDTPSGSDETNKRGRFRIVVDKPNENDFYAVVDKRTIGAGLCNGDARPCSTTAASPRPPSPSGGSRTWRAPARRSSRRRSR